MGRGAVIFDIQRFSIHDGTGIRTSIFFKGCPLHCVWCQNPEGIESKTAVIHVERKCIKCGICLNLAENKGVYLRNGKIYVQNKKEDNWTQMIESCPTGALCMDAKEYTVEELLNEARKDKVFFREKGGITLSGGEPLLQETFAVDFLKKLKQEHINTAIETALYVPLSVLQKAAPWLDQIYADFKLADNEAHKKYTGVSNERIRSNLNWLLTSEHRNRVTVRTPLIPGITDTEKNILEIAEEISSVYPDVRYELLNYNPLAEAKYSLVNRKYCFEENPSAYSEKEMEKFRKIALEHGIHNLIWEQ